MANSRAFRPPRMSPLVLGLVKSGMPFLLGSFAGDLSVQISPDDLATLRSFKGQRLLLLPNHPTHFDPLVMLELSCRVQEDVHFVAAREIFDCIFGLRGWMFQRCGIYSLIRGAVDRESFKTTKDILVQGRHWLVIFIEGEVNLENDAIIPFEPGVLQLALRAQESLAESSAAPIHVAPVAMKTFYHAGVEQRMAQAIIRLEKAVGVTPQGRFTSWPDLAARLIQMGRRILSGVERELGMPPLGADALIGPRFEMLHNRLLGHMESYLDLHPDPEAAVLDRIRAVRNRIDKIMYTYYDLPAELSAYDRRLLKCRRQILQGFGRDLTRLINFLTFKPGYLTPGSAPERFAEVLLRIEQEVIGRQRFTHPRTAVVQLGTPLNLREHLLPDASRDQTKQATQALAHLLESQMLALLSQTPRPAAAAVP